jgi:hypothetical protein
MPSYRFSLFAQQLIAALETAKPRRPRRTAEFLVLVCGGMAGAVLIGCSAKSYTVGPTSGLPPTPPAASSNAYIGTQSPLNWTLSVDDTQNAYSYQSQPTDGSAPITASGTFVDQSGFLNLGAAGLALEMPGAGALLRPGNNTNAPVVMVEQEDCFALSGNQRYLLQGMVSTANVNPVVYRRGDFVASTTVDGKTWSFADAEYIDYHGDSNSPGDMPEPNAFTGACAVANGASSVSIDTTGAYSLPTTFHFDSAGLAVVDYASFPSAVGFAQPLDPINTTPLMGASFRGFRVEYSTTTITQPVSFGAALDGSAGLNGGVYPNDDVTQTADTSDLLVFGAQSSSMNGLFASATMTVLDPKGGCAANGVSQGDLGLTPTGIATCRLHLPAMVGQVNGKAFIVISGIDLTVAGSSAPDIQFYLIQQ